MGLRMPKSPTDAESALNEVANSFKTKKPPVF